MIGFIVAWAWERTIVRLEVALHWANYLIEGAPTDAKSRHSSGRAILLLTKVPLNMGLIRLIDDFLVDEPRSLTSLLFCHARVVESLKRCV